MKFKILHTNDVHSHYENFAKIKTLIDEERDEFTIVVDGGDFADFKRVELLGTKGLLAAKLLEAAHYDAITVGNNETFQGIEILETMALNSKVPFVACNLFKREYNVEGISPYIKIERQGVEFLIIGVCPPLKIFPELMGFSFKDYKEEIQKIISHEPHDVCILVNHIGTKNDEALANTIEGIDMIISAHDHQLYNEAKVIQQTINHSAGSYAENLGVVEFEYKDQQVHLVHSKILNIEDVKPDPDILKILEESKNIAYNNLSKPLFQLSETLYFDFIEECPIGNLLADALKDIFKCDIGLINSGIVSGGIKKGLVNELKLIEICPSPLNPTLIEIKGKDLKEALQLSLNPQVCLNDGKGAGFRGIGLGRLHVSGLTIFHRDRIITNIYVGEKLLDEYKYYTVGTSDYLQRNATYQSLKNHINPKYHVEYFRDTLREYLNKEEFVNHSFTNRWIEE